MKNGRTVGFFEMKMLMFGIHDMGEEVLRALMVNDMHPTVLVTKPNLEGGERLSDLARSASIDVWQPDSKLNNGFIDKVRDLKPDITLVAGYHKKIPVEVIDVPRHKTLNVHGSLLPSYRGPSTWKQAILNGENETGVTIHIMTSELDRGDIIAQEIVPISEEDTGGSLFRKLCSTGARLLPATLMAWMAGNIQARAQDELKATYFSYISEDQAQINWNGSSREVCNHIRALNPRPGAWTTLNGCRIDIESATEDKERSSKCAGTIVEMELLRFRVMTSTKDVWVVPKVGSSALAQGEKLECRASL